MDDYQQMPLVALHKPGSQKYQFLHLSRFLVCKIAHFFPIPLPEIVGMAPCVPTQKCTPTHIRGRL